MSDITQNELRKLFYYDKKMGNLIWRLSLNRGVKPGNIAGSMNKKTGYLRITIRGKGYMAHRLVWLWHYGSWPKDQIDHINRNKAENKIENLRDVDTSTNHFNIDLRKNNKSGVTGVHWYQITKKWCAMIKINNKGKNLGYFGNIFDAACARKSAENNLGVLCP